MKFSLFLTYTLTLRLRASSLIARSPISILREIFEIARLPNTDEVNRFWMVAVMILPRARTKKKNTRCVYYIHIATAEMHLSPRQQMYACFWLCEAIEEIEWKTEKYLVFLIKTNQFILLNN